MAKAREEPGGCTVLEDELTCSICLGLYRNPVLLSCGHSFCKQCIQKALGAQQQSNAPYSCPLCKLQLGPILELQKNFQLCSIVEAYLATSSEGQQGDGSAKGKKEVVHCDFCLSEPLPAVKTCLVCDVSLCQAHLDKHSAAASRQNHVIVEVGAGGAAEERKCQEHGKLLECYCQDDGLCICMLCSVAGQHKGHSIITLKEAREKKLDELSGLVTWLQKREGALAAALEGVQKSEQQLKTNTETVTSHLEKILEDMKAEIIQKKMKILSNIQSIEKNQMTNISKVKKEMEQRRDEAVQVLQSLQKIKEQPDSLCFLKEFKLAKDRVVSQNFSVSWVDVMAVRMDQARIDGYRRVTWDFMKSLDSLLQVLQNELINQIKQRSEASNPHSSSNYKYKDPGGPFPSFFVGGSTPFTQAGFGTGQSQDTSFMFH